jgi:molecular chaperone GrpE
MSRGKKRGEKSERVTEEPAGNEREEAAGQSEIEGDPGDAETGLQEVEGRSSEEIERDPVEEIASLQDQLLRKQAEFENFRKRISREKDEMVRYGNSMLLLDIIEIIDDFERAIKSSEESKDFQAFHSGIVMIENQLTSLLEKKWGLTRFDSEGEEFNPEKHQAIAAEEREDHEHAMVLEVYQKGYYLHDRVLRPAKVKVSQPTTTPHKEEITDSSDGTEGEENGKNNWN